MQRDIDAALRVAQELTKPDPQGRWDMGGDAFFDPWALFPCLYGVYSGAFDDMAISVLGRLNERKFYADNLAEEMFAEILCNADLCEYGTSPRGCFPTTYFQKVIPELLVRWKSYYTLQWETPE